MSRSGSSSFSSRCFGVACRATYEAPAANCLAESWIGSLKRECLNHFFCFSLRQIGRVVQTYALYHNGFRRQQELGKHYYRRAA